MVNSCPLEKGEDVSNKQCYGLSASTKKFQKYWSFYPKNYFWNWDSRLYPRDNFIIMKGLIRVSN